MSQQEVPTFDEDLLDHVEARCARLKALDDEEAVRLMQRIDISSEPAPEGADGNVADIDAFELGDYAALREILVDRGYEIERVADTDVDAGVSGLKFVDPDGETVYDPNEAR